MTPTALVTLLSGVLAPAAPEDGASPASAELAYRIERAAEPELGVAVHLVLPGDPDGTTDLSVEEQWGGVDAGGHDLTDLRATGANAGERAVERTAPHRWRIEHEPGEELAVTYRIPRNAHRSEPDPGTNRRPVVDDVFHAFGHLFLAVPEHLAADEPRAISIEWAGFGEDAGLACSFGVGPGPHRFEASLDRLQQSVFLGGDVVLAPRAVEGETVWLAAHDAGWDFEIDAFADLVAAIVAVERGFFDDFDRPYFLVTLIPVGVRRPGSTSLGGTGLADSFALMIQPGLGLEPGSDGRRQIAKLLAHEMFHDWNGVLLEREDPEELAYWFSEGFTDFYARRLLLRGGLTTVDEYVSSLNAALRAHYTSPVRGEPNERIRADYWNDQDVQRLPYHRGDVVAVVLDHAIRRHSDGARSLDDLMRALVDRSRTGGWKVSTEKLIEEVALWTSPDVAAAVRAVVEDGAAPVLDPGSFAPCLALGSEEIGAFDVGFDLERSMREHTVRGLRPGGPAEAAGLREGQPLAGWSVRRGDTESPVRFVVREGGVERAIEYPPVGERVPVPQFARSAGADPGACAVL